LAALLNALQSLINEAVQFMATTWVLIADRGGARLFKHRGRTTGLEHLRDIPNPKGRLKNGDINADKHGRAFDSMGAGRHAMGKAEPVDQVAEQFARDLAGMLDQGFVQKEFKQLVLVAAPRFLGDLRGALSDNTKAAIKDTINKDLSGINERELPKHLAEVLPL
jgi:protein required for attachment to host cells